METKIYYYRTGFTREAIMLSFSQNIPADFPAKINDVNYACVYTMPHVKKESEEEIYQYLESLFAEFNSDENPLYQNNHGGHRDVHSSMSAGDIVSYNNNKYIVMGFGFKKI